MRSIQLAICSIIIISTQASAQTRLVLKQPVEGDVEVTARQSYQLPLVAGDYVTGTVTQRGRATVWIYYPDGQFMRRAVAPSADGKRSFTFAAENAGIYRLELATEGTPSAQFTLEIEAVAALSDRLAPRLPAESNPSPRITALNRDIASGTTNPEAFWRQVEGEGTPLVEIFPGDKAYQLVTFLWRATYVTRNVLVLGSFQGLGSDLDNVMRQIPNTDIWYLTMKLPTGARFTYQLSPNDSMLADGPLAPVIEDRVATAQMDPLNPRRYNCAAGLSKFVCRSLAELPGAAPQPWLEKRSGVPEGRTETVSIRSDTQQIDRAVTVYTPAGYRADGPQLPLVLLFDGESYVDMGLATTLENLIAAERIPPVVAVLVRNAPGRRAADLVPNQSFETYVIRELMPWVRQRYNVIANPGSVVIGGSSLGGLTAAYLGLRHPDVFGNVLSQSGAFWWAEGMTASDAPDATKELNGIARLAIDQPKASLRFYLEAGTFEAPKGPDLVRILVTTRHLRDVLAARGYDVQYHQFAGGHEAINWRGSVADGLVALLRR